MLEESWEDVVGLCWGAQCWGVQGWEDRGASVSGGLSEGRRTSCDVGLLCLLGSEGRLHIPSGGLTGLLDSAQLSTGGERSQ